MNHGIVINEKPTALSMPVASDSAIQVAVGTAPINLTQAYIVNQPVLANSYSEAVTKLGWSSNFKDYTLCQVMSASFQVFNVKPVVFINVLDPAVHKAEVAAASMSVQNKQVVLEVAGILLPTIVVQSDDGATTYKPDADYATAFDDLGMVTISILPGGQIPEATATLKVGYSKLDPTAVTEADIIGGYTAATGTYKGIECISQVHPQLGVVPCILTAPGWSHKPSVAMALLGKCENLNSLFNCIAYVDIDSSVEAAPTYDKVKVWKDSNSYTDKWMYPLWPKVVVGKQTYYMSALAAALTAYTDSTNNGVPALSPSNKSLRITGVVNEAGDEVNLDVAQADFVNDGGVTTAIKFGGWVLWGNYAGAFPENRDPKDYWLNYRRLFAWDNNNTVLSFMGKTDGPISYRLIQDVVASKNMQGHGFVAAGNMGAYGCTYVPEENPITDIIAGVVKFQLTLSPYPPAQLFVFTQMFDAAALEAAMTGGGS